MDVAAIVCCRNDGDDVGRRSGMKGDLPSRYGGWRYQQLSPSPRSVLAPSQRVETWSGIARWRVLLVRRSVHGEFRNDGDGCSVLFACVGGGSCRRPLVAEATRKDRRSGNGNGDKTKGRTRQKQDTSRRRAGYNASCDLSWALYSIPRKSPPRGRVMP